MSLSLKHRKCSIRALTCLVWMCITWVYLQPPLMQDLDGEPEVDDEDEGGDRDVKGRKRLRGREAFWKLTKSVVEIQTGTTTIAALLSSSSNVVDTDGAIRRFLQILKAMMLKGDKCCSEAMACLKQLLSFEPPSYSQHTFEVRSLITPGLFSAWPDF